MIAYFTTHEPICTEEEAVSFICSYITARELMQSAANRRRPIGERGKEDLQPDFLLLCPYV